jgi:hypothetical protein
MTTRQQAEPVSRSHHFLVGRNSAGQWVARDREAHCGGLFDSRDEALRFVLRELGESPSAIVLVSDVLELFGSPAHAGAASSTTGARPAEQGIHPEV